MGRIVVKGISYSAGSYTTYATDWNASGQYIVDDFVRYDKLYFRCIKACTGADHSPVDSTCWEPANIGDAHNALNRKVGVATTSTVGLTKPDGSTIKIDNDGTIHAVGSVASSVTYSNETSKLEATNVQAAIDEVVSMTPDFASEFKAGIVQPDGVTIVVGNDGVISAVDRLNMRVVDELPTTDISTSTIYLVPKDSSKESNVYDEFVYVNNAWEKIGDTAVDLTDYLKKTGDGSKLTSGIAASNQEELTNLTANSKIEELLGVIDANITLIKKMKEELDAAKKAAGFWIGTQTIPMYTDELVVENADIKSDSLVDIYYSDESNLAAVQADISYVLENGKLTFIVDKPADEAIVIANIHVYNP